MTLLDAWLNQSSRAAPAVVLCLSGIEPAARPEAWKFLLGVYRPGSSSSTRQQEQQQQQQQYLALKAQWQSIGPDQAKRFSKWRDRRSRIDKDVQRTDR
jgi:hypothetical protein